MLRQIGEFAGWVGRPIAYIGRRILSFLRRYGRALWAIRHDRSALLLRFELGFINNLTSWSRPGSRSIYCWSMEQWGFELSNSMIPDFKRTAQYSVTIPRPFSDQSVLKYEPGDLVTDLRLYGREDGKRYGIVIDRATIVSVLDTLYGDYPVVVLSFDADLEGSKLVKAEIVNEGIDIVRS